MAFFGVANSNNIVTYSFNRSSRERRLPNQKRDLPCYISQVRRHFDLQDENCASFDFQFIANNTCRIIEDRNVH
jgi:hypothetical protein